MFATLLGPLPRPPLAASAVPEEILVAIMRAQEEAGLEPLIDSGFGIGDSPAERWRATAALTDRPVKGALLGPFSAGRAAAVGRTDADRPDADRAGRLAAPDAGAWADAALAVVETLHADLLALASAGCAYVEIHEPAAIEIGTDQDRRALFRDLHRRLLDGVGGTHLSLAITGGNADAAGVETLLAAPYASLAIDLIAGPDNWRLAVATPGDRGIVAGAMSSLAGSDDGPEVLVWAAGYAASTGRRGPGRVGLASASSLAHLPWDVALRKLERLGEAARLADLPPAERRRRLDPRAVDIRSAALGRYEPRPPSAVRRRRRHRPADLT